MFFCRGLFFQKLKFKKTWHSLTQVALFAKVFAYCRESPRKHFRSIQNAPKRPPGVPLGFHESPLELQVAHKESPRRAQEALKSPKELRSGRQGIPKGSPRDPKGIPRHARRSPGDPQGVPEGPQGVPKGPPGVPKGSPGGPQRVPEGSPRVTGRLRSRWNDGVAPKLDNRK